MKSWDTTQSSDSDSESELEEEEPSGNSPFGSHYHRIQPSSHHDSQRPFSDIYEMQGDLDKLVRFFHREVEGLAGSTSAFNVLAFTLEDWDR